MVQLKLSVEIVEFDLTHATIQMTVLNKRTRDGAANGGSKQASSTNLKMTLPELHIFLRAMLEFNGPLEITTPDLDRDQDGEDFTDYDDDTGFLGDKVLFDPSEAAE